MSAFYYHTIRARVRNPLIPVDVLNKLPMHLTRIVGIRCGYSSGIERIVPYITADSIPRIGWFTLDVNNRKRTLGAFDVSFSKPWVETDNSFQEIDIAVQPGSMITGTYNNELMYPYGGKAVTGNKGGTITTGGSGGNVSGGQLLISPVKKIDPTQVVITNPANTDNYDGYIVAIHLKCLSEKPAL